jgi:hypothetical protein
MMLTFWLICSIISIALLIQDSGFSRLRDIPLCVIFAPLVAILAFGVWSFKLYYYIKYLRYVGDVNGRRKRSIKIRKRRASSGD